MWKSVVTGRVTKDVELRRNGENDPWAVFCVASNRPYRRKTEEGEMPEITDYINVFVYGQFAETCARHLKKGMQVTCCGNTEQNMKTDSTGKQHYNIEIKNADVVWTYSNRTED